MDNVPRSTTECEYAELKSKISLMQYEWRCQQNTIGRLKIRMTKLQSQLTRQARFCSKVGSVFGYCLWKATQTPEIVNNMTHQDRMLELSEVMNGALESFDETYGTQVPVGDTDETRFVLSVIGLVANLAAVDAGRRFFSQTDSGKNVVGRVMSVAPRVPSPAGNQLKKIAYAALYNVSVYPVASPQMINATLVSALNGDIGDADNKRVEPDLRLFALRLLRAILRNVCTRATYDVLKNNVDQSRILKLTSAVDAETETAARNILDDFRKAKEQFEPKILMT